MNTQSALQARDAGMQRAVEHADRDKPNWSDEAFDFLLNFANTNLVFISEDVSDAHKAAGLPQPPTDRAWGWVYRKAVKRGVIVMHGQGRSRRRHASICPRWRSQVYRSKKQIDEQSDMFGVTK